MSEQDPNEDQRRATAVGLAMFSRVIAVLILSLLPVLIGYYLDRWTGWKVFVIAAACLSLLLAISGLLAIASQANRELKTHRRQASGSPPDRD